MRDKQGRFVKGHIHTKEALKKIGKASKGRKPTPKQLQALKKMWGFYKGKKIPQITGDKHPAWKGDKASQSSIHSWVKRIMGTPNVCDFCGKISDNKVGMHWSNKDHKYKRDLNDWQRLCASCHKQYDYDNKLIQPKGFKPNIV